VHFPLYHKWVDLSFLKRFYLKYIIGYKNPRKYWDQRWKTRIDNKDSIEFRRGMFKRISSILSENECSNVLEIGCGHAWLRELPNYLGIDFSLEALKQSNLPAFLFSDTTKHIPLPSKCFDAAISISVLIHIPERDIEKAITEISRVTKKCIILQESSVQSNQPHCFSHDYENLFKKHFEGKVYFLNE